MWSATLVGCVFGICLVRVVLEFSDFGVWFGFSV